MRAALLIVLFWVRRLALYTKCLSMLIAECRLVCVAAVGHHNCRSAALSRGYADVAMVTCVAKNLRSTVFRVE